MTAPNNYPAVSNGSPVDADAWFNPVAQDLSAVSNFFSGGAGWTAYTPVFSWAGGSLNIGNGSYTGGYRKLGSLYLIRATINTGSTTTWTGTVNEASFSLPPALVWNFGTFFAGSGNFWGVSGYSVLAPNGANCFFRLASAGNLSAQSMTPGSSKAGFGLMVEAP